MCATPQILNSKPYTKTVLTLPLALEFPQGTESQSKSPMHRTRAQSFKTSQVEGQI